MFAMNSIEPAAAPKPIRKPVWQPAPDEPPIREATQAETRKLQPRPAPHDAEPDAVARKHSLYTADKALGRRAYYSDYKQQSEVMRASANRITTKHDDRRTVSAMLDLAAERGWGTIKLSGSNDFKREVWVQARVRGMETTGYKPQATDLQEVDRRINAVTPAAQTIKVNPAPVAQPAKPPEAAAQVTKSAEVNGAKSPASKQDRYEKFRKAWDQAERTAQAMQQQKQKQKQNGVNGMAPKHQTKEQQQQIADAFIQNTIAAGKAVQQAEQQQQQVTKQDKPQPQPQPAQ